MAKALKVGEQVTVTKPVEFTKRSPERAKGLESIQSGEIGTVVGMTEGRSVRVEFNGVETVISAQKLERFGEGNQSSGTGRRGRPRQSAASTQMLNYSSREFIREVANKLLMSGDAANQQSVAIEINLSDLPADIQTQIRSLIRAKLDLDAPGTAASTATSKQASKAAPKQAASDQPRRKRGRPPGKKNKKRTASGTKRGPKPKQAISESETQS
jgi:hypothetical protein